MFVEVELSECQALVDPLFGHRRGLLLGSREVGLADGRHTQPDRQRLCVENDAEQLELDIERLLSVGRKRVPRDPSARVIPRCLDERR